MDIRGSGDEIEEALKRVFMDSKSFAITFPGKLTNRQKAAWFRHANRVYQSIGGGWIEWNQNPDDATQYVIRPRDDPDQNY